MAKQTITVTEQTGTIRVDKLLAETLPEYSRSALAKLFTLNLIKLNGEPIQPGHKLRPGAVIEYDLGPLQEKPDVIELPILYEDDDVVVINKPSGVISHARGRFWQEASVASFLREHVVAQSKDKNQADVLFDTVKVTNALDESEANQSLRAGIVHRLDRATSGIMICAKNKKTLAFLQKQFSDRKVAKTYIAITQKPPREQTARIVAPIARDASNPKRFIVDKNGKNAETLYRVLGKTEQGYAIELHPQTGRTHQLRVHLDYIDCPIVGDTLYKGIANDRLLLHAYELVIDVSPGHSMTFVAPIPQDFGFTTEITRELHNDN